MSETTGQIGSGSTVWAPTGAYGWRPAVVVVVPARSRHRKVACLRFESGRKGRGTRFVDLLRPRDPQLRGADKPTPADAAAQLVAS